jgi:protein arginine N-methyltransferase 2
MAADVYFAVADYEASSEEQLSLTRCQTVTLIEERENGWWWVESNDCYGYVPSNHLSDSYPEDKWQDDEYFGSYHNLKIHREMLGDYPRTLTYKKAVEKGSLFFKDRVILDLGCGTGILSLFYLTLTEAKKVYAVEASPMAVVAKEIIQNNVKDHSRFEVLQGKVEDIELGEKVDVIVSEWMGTFLLFEMVLESVMIARDRWLKPDGLLWPSNAQLFLVPCQAEVKYKQVVGFWNDVHGFNFSCVIPQALEESCSSPIHDYVLEESDVLAPPVVILDLDIKTVQIADLEEMQCIFSFEVSRNGTFHGFGSWFDVTFGSLPVQNYENVTLSTGPGAPLTHWKQDFFLFPHPFQVQKGEKLKGELLIERNKKWRRHLRVTFKFKFFGRDDGNQKEYSHTYGLWK